MTTPQRATALYVVLDADAAASQRAAAAVACPLVQSVLIRPAPGQQLDPTATGRLVALVQRADIAALIAQDARLARTLKADGVHLAWSPTLADDYAAAREMLGGRAIVGVDAGSSRHDAIELAEAGADYIAFGVTSYSGSAIADRLDLVAWWAETVIVPCVAPDAADESEAASLARSGADFVGLTFAPGETLADSAARLEAYAAVVAAVVADATPSQE